MFSLMKLSQLVAFLLLGFDHRVELLGLCASLIASLLFTWLCLVEHKRSIRPSTLTAIYLLATVCGNLLGAVPELLSFRTPDILLFWRCGEILVQMVLLVLESQNKTASLLCMYKGVSPEDSAGILSRTFWWWLMDLLAVGKQRILRVSDTPRLSSSLQPSLTRKAVLQAWGIKEASR